jgi:phosphinothricin acetyltransferase
VSVYIDAQHHRQGLGTRLYGSLFALLAEQGYRTLLAGVALPNPASLNLHHRLSFIEVGVFRNVGWKAGAWRDVAWLQRSIGAPPSETAAPHPPGAPVRLGGPVVI